MHLDYGKTNCPVGRSYVDRVSVVHCSGVNDEGPAVRGEEPAEGVKS